MEKNSTLNSFFWKLLERVGNQLINFLITIVLARILGPSEYGIVALISIFITFATVMVQDGFNATLIRRKNIDNDEFTSSFYFSSILAVILYIILFFSSKFIASFYDMQNLDMMLRVLSLVLFPAALNSIQTAFYTKKFQFKKMFFCNFTATALSGIISIVLAVSGAKAWALIFNQLLYQILSCVFLWLFGKWRPIGKFSYNKIKGLVGFGSKMLFTSLLTNLFLNIRSLLIGKIYSSSELGFFNRGKSFSSTVMDGINGSIQTVLLPTYANIQENIEKMTNAIRKSINISCYIIFPALIGLACIAKPLILTLLGEQWLEAVPYVQIFALTYLFQPTQISTAQAFKALGKGNIVLGIEVVRKIFELLLLVMILYQGPIYIALSALVAGIFAITITLIPNKKYLNYEIGKQIKDFMIPLVNSAIMGGAILMLNHILNINHIALLIIDVILGVMVYIVISILEKNANYSYLKQRAITIYKTKFAKSKIKNIK